MKAVITVTGKDTRGIIAKMSGACAEYGANIIDISQSVLRQEYFAMMMLVDTAELRVAFAEFSDKLQKLGRENALDVHVMHEDVFNSMHRI